MSRAVLYAAHLCRRFLAPFHCIDLSLATPSAQNEGVQSFGSGSPSCPRVQCASTEQESRCLDRSYHIRCRSTVVRFERLGFEDRAKEN